MNITTSAVRFALVGVAVTLIHVMVAAGLIERGGLHPGIANGVAFVAANLASYVANTCWSFQARMRLGNWGRFVAISFAAWMLTMIIASAVAETGGHYLLGISLVVALVPMLTFVAHQRFTYRHSYRKYHEKSCSQGKHNAEE